MPSRCQNNKEVRSNPRKTKKDEIWIHCFTHIFFHPDYTVGFGVSPNQRTQKSSVADCTASGEFHPALKTLDFSCLIYYMINAAEKQDSELWKKEKARIYEKFKNCSMQIGRIILK